MIIMMMMMIVNCFRHLHCAGQWLWTASGNISLPHDDSAAGGKAEGDAGHVRGLP